MKFRPDQVERERVQARDTKGFHLTTAGRDMAAHSAYKKNDASEAGRPSGARVPRWSMKHQIVLFCDPSWGQRHRRDCVRGSSMKRKRPGILSGDDTHR
jgi:hypothetical protein